MTSIQSNAAGLEALEKEYCPPIDNALFYAIALDFDLSNAKGVKAAREVLDNIKATACEQEQDPNFDPSGTSVPFGLDGTDMNIPESSTGTQTATSTDVTSLSSGLRGLVLKPLPSSSSGSDDSGSSWNIEEMQSADEETKMAALMQMFPNASEYSVKHTLKSCKGDYRRAVEELLNHDYFNSNEGETGADRILAKGIDAFSEDSIIATTYHRRKTQRAPNKRNRKFNRNGPIIMEGDDSGSNSDRGRASTPSNMWSRGQDDIDFIASRTCIPSSTISSVYYKHGASLRSTLIALLESPSALGSASENTESGVKELAAELGAEFQCIPQHLLLPLIQAAYPSTASAHELAKTLVPIRRQSHSPPSRPSSRYNPGIIPQYTPVEISSVTDGPLLPQRRASNISRTLSDSRLSRNGSARSMDAKEAAAYFQSKVVAARESEAAAHQRGRSDHLMRAAAGYYSQVGRDMATRRDEAVGKAADELVASQSRSGEIDLHGVNVKDAQRIASDACIKWWRSSKGGGIMGLDGRVFRGDDRNSVASGKGRDPNAGGHGVKELRIITGLGRHSKGGVGKIHPAIRAMLDRGAWRFEECTGYFIVTGKRE